MPRPHIATSLSLPLAVLALGAGALAQTTTRASVAVDGSEANGPSKWAAVSFDGSRVAFASQATDLGFPDPYAFRDAFVRDLAAGTTLLVNESALSPGQPANGHVQGLDLSASGRWVAFASGAQDLVSPPPAGSGTTALWLRDLETGTTQVGAVRLNGMLAGVDGHVSISADGRYVAFVSGNTDVVPGDTNLREDVFVHDRLQGTTVRASVAANGTQPNGHCQVPSISPDGRFVAFNSAATNLEPGTGGHVQIWLKDLQSGALHLASRGLGGAPASGPSQTADVSHGGRFVAFNSAAQDLAPNNGTGFQIYVRDLLLGTTERASVNDGGVAGNNYCYNPAISADGRFVAFQTTSSNLGSGANSSAYQVLLRDRQAGTTRTMSLAPNLQIGSQSSGLPALSGDGRFVAFESDASNLVPGDGNGTTDVFLRDRKDSGPFVYGVAQVASIGCVPATGWSGTPSASAPGGFTITCAQVRSAQPGVLFYGLSGAAVIPFQGAFLYVKPPTRRTPVQLSGGSPSGNDCSGAFGLDFNAWIASGADPALVAGADVWSQHWSRDPGSPSSTNLSDALVFTIRP